MQSISGCTSATPSLPEAPKDRAVLFAQNVRKIVPSTCTLTAEHWYHIALFIETQLSEYVMNRGNTVHKRESGLARTLNYNPATSEVIIRLKAEESFGQMNEAERRVKRENGWMPKDAVLYDVLNPRIGHMHAPKGNLSLEIRVHKPLRYDRYTAPPERWSNVQVPAEDIERILARATDLATQLPDNEPVHVDLKRDNLLFGGPERRDF